MNMRDSCLWKYISSPSQAGRQENKAVDPAKAKQDAKVSYRQRHLAAYSASHHAVGSIHTNMSAICNLLFRAHKLLMFADTPQFLGGNPYFFNENPYQSVSFIYAWMYRENVHAIDIAMQFANKSRHCVIKISSKEPKSELYFTRRDSRIRPMPLID